ncbi:hypothetical protein B0O99DRAFT_622834 [Bisporella sp. PMI_857]|nr:hypothetical protein B0O99DRAFT_622834 [Bisporella sp. PMI_857]
MVVSSFVRPAVGHLLAVFASATITFVDSGPKTSVGGSLKLLSLCSVFLLFLALCRCRLTSDFLVHKLYAKGYLPPFAKKFTKTFQVNVNQLLINLQLLVSFR